MEKFEIKNARPVGIPTAAIRMTPELKEKLDIFVKKNGVSINTAVVQMIEYCLNASE